MLRLVVLLVLSSGGSVGASAGELTFAEVKNLPTSRLAERVLGEAGKLMMDVERPRSDLAYEQIKFFSYPFAPGSQFGICASDWTSLQFNEHGVIEFMSSERRYGVEASIYADPDSWTYNEYGAMCERVKNTRSYFPAPDAQAALTIAAYIDALAGNGPSQPQNYQFDCSGSCANVDVGAYIKNIPLSTITKADEIDCDQSTPYDNCYKLVLHGQPPGLYPRELRIYGTMKMNRVDISRVRLWMGVTLF